MIIGAEYELEPKEGHVIGVKRWLTLDDPRLAQLDDFGPREAMTIRRPDGTFREVRYCPFEPNTNLLRFSFRTDDEIKSYDLSGKTYSSAEEKAKAQAKPGNFEFIDEDTERLRGEIFLGPTFTQSETAKTQFFQFIEKRQEITEARQLKYLKSQFALDLLNMPVTALLELPIPVNTATDFLYSSIFRPDLKGLQSAPKPQEIGRYFGPIYSPAGFEQDRWRTSPRLLSGDCLRLIRIILKMRKKTLMIGMLGQSGMV